MHRRSGDELVVVRGADRAVTTTGGVLSRHSFSFGAHYSPANTHFGVLVASNDDVVAPGDGYPQHSHRDVEILTWVVAGTLQHRDSTGRLDRLTRGMVGCLSAGTGVEHSELNAGSGEPLHLVQMWVVPDAPPAGPSYQVVDTSDALATRELVTVAAGDLAGPVTNGAVAIRRTDAVLRAGRLGPGGSVVCAGAPYVHVFVATGSTALEGVGELAAGDAARLVTPGARGMTAGAGGAEVLVWEMQSSL